MQEELGLDPADESSKAYLLFHVPKDREAQLPEFLQRLDAARQQVGRGGAVAGLVGHAHGLSGSAGGQGLMGQHAVPRLCIILCLPDPPTLPSSSHLTQLGVTDVQIGLASLEEVFLAIARRAEMEAAAAEGRTTLAWQLEDGSTLEVGGAGMGSMIGPLAVASNSESAPSAPLVNDLAGDA